MDEKWILVVGNVVDGIVFDGPFDSQDEAHDYGERIRKGEWIIAPLREPRYG
jgi:hypothetical protein